MCVRRYCAWLVVLTLALVSCKSSPGSEASAAATIAAAKATEAAAEATKAAARVILVATPLPQAGPSGTGAPGPGAPTAPTAAATQAVTVRAPTPTLPSMPSPKECPEQSKALWHWQAGDPRVNAFFFTTSLAGFAVGAPDVLLRTKDGGSTWTLWPIDCPEVLNAIWFSSPQTGWIAGDHGTILRSTDGGLAWKRQESGTRANLDVIKFLDDKTGWAGGSGGTLLRTTDAGGNWAAGATGQQFEIADVSFVDAHEGYLVGHEEPIGYVLHTLDGGATWQNTDFWGSVPEAIFVGKGLTPWIGGGWVGGDLWKGIGHDSLTSVVSDLFPPECGGTGYQFRRVHFSDAQHGWAVGDCGLAIFTRDGGKSWQPMSTHPSANWRMLRFTSEQEAVLAGYSYEDGIQVAHSSDGGKTWSAAAAGSTLTSDLHVLEVDFIDRWFGWALVEEGSSSRSSLLATSDGGNSWERREPPGGAVGRVQFVDRLRGWAIGQAGLIARTDDGGRTWQIQPLQFGEVVQAAWFLDREHGWLISTKTETVGVCPGCGFSERCLALFRTSSGGERWEGPICIQVPQWSEWYSGIEWWHDIQFTDANTGWIVAAKGVVIKTSDGGLTWQPQTVGTAVDLGSLCFLDAQTGWVAGQGGVLLATADGGANWSQQRLGSNDLRAVHFVNRQMGWVSSAEREVFQTSDGGRTWSTTTLHEEYGGPTVLDAIDGDHVWVGTSAAVWAYAPACLSPGP